jgi:UrcA family protein
MTIDKKSASISLAAGLALALAAGAGSAASAKEVTVVGKPIPTDALTETVSVADLNLASASGAKTLKYRVRGAVGRVCEPLEMRENIIEHGYCRSFAWSEARPQMDRAIIRAQQLAANGTTSIAPVAIVISAPQR